MVESCCFHAVYRLVDSWQEIVEYQQLTIRKEHPYPNEAHGKAGKTTDQRGWGQERILLEALPG